MTSVFNSELSNDSDDDSDYKPPVELFFEDGKSSTLNLKENIKFKNKTRNSHHLLETNLNFDNKLKEVKKSEVNLEAKNQADYVYKNFLKEAAAEMKLLKNERITSTIVTSAVNSTSSVNTDCYIDSCSSNINIHEKANDAAKNISPKKYLKLDISTNSISNLNKNSMSSQLSTTKKRGLKSVLGNVLKKSKKETILSTSMQDWNKFKQEEDIVDELKLYNQGKNGFIERQRFLERSDFRRFHIEREMRMSNRQTKNNV